MTDPTAAERMRRMRLRKKRGLVSVTVDVPKGRKRDLLVLVAMWRAQMDEQPIPKD